MIDHFFQVLFIMGSLLFGDGAEPYGSEVGQPIAGSGQRAAVFFPPAHYLITALGVWSSVSPVRLLDTSVGTRR